MVLQVKSNAGYYVLFINTNKRTTLHTLTTNKVYKDYFYFYIDSLYIEDIHDCIEIKTSNPLLLIHKIIFSLFFVKFFNIDSLEYNLSTVYNK